MELKRCPCGQIPPRLILVPCESRKWCYATPECCGEWPVEFRRDYVALDGPKIHELAARAWNDKEVEDE